MSTQYPDAKKLQKNLAAGKPEQMYLFLGPEEGEKEKFIDAVLDILFDDADLRRQSTSRFHIENDEFTDALDFALSSSMFSSRKVCIMKNIDTFRSEKKKKELFMELIHELPDSTTLIMTSKENKPPPFITPKNTPGIQIYQFWKHFDRDIYSYVLMHIKKMGREIENDALNHLIDLTGRDIKKLDDALDMLLFSGTQGPINMELVTRYVIDNKEITIFEFIDALFNRNSISLKLLKKLLSDGTPELNILFMITRHAEMIEKYHLFLKEGAPPDDAMKKSGVFNRNRGVFLDQTKKFSPVQLHRVFSIISSTDYAIKSGRTGKEFISNPLVSCTTAIIFDQ